ncbi:MAG: PKD domain-containing protein, partial [Flavobacteriales bacterium]|nr:PKD domain-containing protein [Flavobacteriales bacterium]
MSTDQVLVEVPADMEASFELEGEGCTPLTLIADNTSEGAFSYFWQFGDGDISNEYEPSHTFFNWTQSDTTYTITLIVQNTFGCTDTATSTVTVFPVPIAQFSATPGVQTWPDATIDIDNTTVGGSLNYEWDMDDGTTITVENPGSYTFSTWGEYTIELFVTNGSCSSTYSQTVEVLAPQPVANFTGPASGCVPLTVTFTNLSEYAAGYLWQFGDGGSANSSTPVYTYWQPGTYTVSLTAYGFDGSQDQMVQEYIIEVYPTAFAAFTVTPSEVNVPGQPVYCLNLSQQADTFFWEFGDGGTSNLESPIYFYQQPGTYSVTLIANNEYNCPDTMTVLDAVRAIAIGQLDFPNAFTPNNSGPGSGIYDPHSFDNDVFFPLHLGVEEYELQIFNKWGELLFESNDVWRGWDGYYRGALCKQDVYVWKAKARFVDGQSIVKTGDVTLLVR